MGKEKELIVGTVVGMIKVLIGMRIDAQQEIGKAHICGKTTSCPLARTNLQAATLISSPGQG